MQLYCSSLVCYYDTSWAGVVILIHVNILYSILVHTALHSTQYTHTNTHLRRDVCLFTLIKTEFMRTRRSFVFNFAPCLVTFKNSSDRMSLTFVTLFFSYLQIKIVMHSAPILCDDSCQIECRRHFFVRIFMQKTTVKWVMIFLLMIFFTITILYSL